VVDEILANKKERRTQLVCFQINSGWSRRRWPLSGSD